MVKIDDVEFFANVNVGNLSILKIHYLIGKLHDRGCVTCNIKVLVVLANAHNQWT